MLNFVQGAILKGGLSNIDFDDEEEVVKNLEKLIIYIMNAALLVQGPGLRSAPCVRIEHI